MKTTTRNTGIWSSAVALLLALALAPPTAAHAEGVTGKGTFSTAFASRYVWRGQILSAGVVAQPTVGITLGGFNANLWSNVDLDKAEEDDNGVVLNETDLTLNYTLAIDKVSLTLGGIYYDFDGADTEEIYLTCAVATLLNPTLSVYYDVDEGKGAFAILGLSQGIPVGPISLTAGGSVGFNLGDKAMGLEDDGDYNGLYSGEVYLATSIPVFGNVSIDPRVAYSTALGSDGKAAIEAISTDGKKSIFYGSLAVTAAF